ncbi:hypothetical protein EsH8_IV_001382 [Colletotrichum jinshuiense]
MPMSTYLNVGGGLPADDLRPSYEEAIAEGANPAAPRAPSVSGSIASLSLHNGTLAPSILRLSRLGRAVCHSSPVAALVVSPRGFVATSQDNTTAAASASTKLWDFRTKPAGASARLVLSDSNDAPGVVFSPDGKFLAAEEKEAGAARGWRLKIRPGDEGKGAKFGVAGVGMPAAFSRDGRMLAATDPAGIVVVFGMSPAAQAAPPTKKIAGIVSHAPPTHVLFMPNGLDLVTLCKDGTVRVSEATTGRTLRRMEVDGAAAAATTGACALGVSPDGRVVVSVWSRAVYVWEHEAGRVSSWELNKARNNEGWPLAVSPDCRLLACRTEEGMDISDVYSGQVLAEVRTAVGIEGLVTTAAFSGDGKTMAVGRYNGVVDVWDLAPFEH